MTKPQRAWVVRAGNDNTLAESVEEKKAIAIGWAEMGDLMGLIKREEFKERYRDVYKEDSERTLRLNAGQVYRYTREIMAGDYILTYDKDSREILVGISEKGFFQDSSYFSQQYPYIRKVKWLGRISRDKFSHSARKTLGGQSTVFQATDHLEEIHGMITGIDINQENLDEVEAVPPFYDDTKAKADELISDMISKLDSYDFQDLVAGVVAAMGYYSKSSPPGSDKGVDVIAYPDALGFEFPRIKAQVKHRKGKAESKEMRAFIGTLQEGENGLFVSTGGFTNDAKQAGEVARITMFDRDEFIQLMLENYETLEPEFRAMVPLKRIWLPLD